ncbi:Serine/threonine-protein phosphatase 6 regulatory ankyrin repeat subunit B [Pelomyxa schiedti]|nr:Serine/threonine-protein phosphatase 6 regulatory ankyrin repeat subunit B [Pelomyxa schiedti]
MIRSSGTLTPIPVTSNNFGGSPYPPGPETGSFPNHTFTPAAAAGNRAAADTAAVAGNPAAAELSLPPPTRVAPTAAAPRGGPARPAAPRYPSPRAGPADAPAQAPSRATTGPDVDSPPSGPAAPPPSAMYRDSGSGSATAGGDAPGACVLYAQQTSPPTVNITAATTTTTTTTEAAVATTINSSTRKGTQGAGPLPSVVQNNTLTRVPSPTQMPTSTAPPLQTPVVLNTCTDNGSVRNCAAATTAPPLSKEREEYLAFLQKQTNDTKHLFSYIHSADEASSFDYLLPVLDVVYASIVSHIHQNRLSAIGGTAQQFSSFLAAMQPQIDLQGDLLFSSLHQHLTCLQRKINKIVEGLVSHQELDMASIDYCDSRVTPVHWKQLPSSTTYFEGRIQQTLTEVKGAADPTIVDAFFARDLLCATFLYSNANPTLAEHAASTHCTKLLNCYMCRVMHLPEKGVRNKLLPIVNDFYLLFKEKWASLPLAETSTTFLKLGNEFLQEKASHQQWDMFMSKYIRIEKLRPPFQEQLKRHQLIALSIYVSTLRGMNDSALSITTQNRVGDPPAASATAAPAAVVYLKALCNLFLTLASSLKLFFFPILEDISHPLDLFTNILQNKKKFESMAGTAGSAFPWILLQSCQSHLQQLLEIQVSLAKNPKIPPFPDDPIPRSSFSPEQSAIIKGAMNTVGMMKHFFPIQYGAVCYIRGLLDSSMEAAIDRTSKMMETSPEPDFSPVNQFHLDFLARVISDSENMVEGLCRYNLSSESDIQFTQLKKRWKEWLSSFKLCQNGATSTATAPVPVPVPAPAPATAKDLPSVAEAPPAWLPPNSLKTCKDLNKSDYEPIPSDEFKFLPILAEVFLDSLSDGGAVESDSPHVIPLKHFYGAFPHRTKVSFWNECKKRAKDEATKVALDKAQAVLSSFPSPNGFRPGPFEERAHFEEKLRFLFQASETSSGGNKYTLALAGLSGGAAGDIHPKVVDRLQLDQIAEELEHSVYVRSHNHLVKPVDIEDQVFYFKFFPEIPAYEQAVSLLHDRIIGFGTAKSVFGKLTIRKLSPTPVEEVYPVLISEKIQGPTFDSYLATESDRPFPSEMFTKLLIMGLITMPEDGKPNNFIFEERTGKLVGIDNDRAFSPPEVNVGTEGRFKSVQKLMMVKSVIFCLSQIGNYIDSAASQEFLLLNPMSLMKDWMKDLEKIHNMWKILDITPEEREMWTRPIATELPVKEEAQSYYQKGCLALFYLPPGLIDDLFISMSSLQAIIRMAGPPLTGLQLLESVMPESASKFYIDLHQDHQTASAALRFQKIREQFYHGNSSSVSTRSMLSSRIPPDKNGGPFLRLRGGGASLRDENMLLHEVERDSRILSLIKDLIVQGNPYIFEKLHGGLQFKIANKLVWQETSPVVQKKVLGFMSKSPSTQPKLKLRNYTAEIPLTKILAINPHFVKVTVIASCVSQCECSFPRQSQRLQTITIERCQSLRVINLLEKYPALSSVNITSCEQLQTLRISVPIESLQELHIECSRAVNVIFSFRGTSFKKTLQVSTHHKNFSEISRAAISGDYSLANRYNTSMEFVRTIIRHVSSSLLTDLEPNHAILKAAEAGELTELASLIRCSPGRRPTDRDGCTALMLAAKNRHTEAVWLLLDNGYSVDDVDNFGATAISHAVCGGHQTTVELLVKRGASLSVRAHDGKTALLLACAAGQLEMITWLLLHGSTLEERDNLNVTALMCAAWKGQLNVVMWLVEEKSCNIEEKDSFDRTALLHAAIGRQLAVIEYLHSKGASMTTKASDGKTALMLWLLDRRAEAAKSSSADAVEYFLKHGVCVDEKDNLSQTAFLLAVDIGDLPTMKLLHSRGASLDVSCKRNGNTPFLLAARCGNLTMIKWVISKLSRPLWEYINQSNDIGNTAFLYASQRGHLNVMKYLAEKGAEITQTNSLGENAAHQAAGGGHAHVLEWLKSQKVPLTARTKGDGAAPILVAAFTGNLSSLSWLLTNGAIVSERDDKYNTVLLTALSSRHMDIVQWLLDEMHAPMTDTNRDGCNCIMLAAGCGKVELLNKMKTSGVPVLGKSKPYGLTTLMYAAMGGNLDAMKWLVEQGAQVAETDAMGNSALFYVADSENIEAVKWLTQSPQGLTVSQTAKDGSTPLLRSARKGNLAMVEWLLPRAGWNLEEESFFGTILHAACHSGNLLLVRFICAKMNEMGILGKNINKNNALGNTPLDQALISGHYDVVCYLREKGAQCQADNNSGTRVLHYNIVWGSTQNFIRLLTAALKSGAAAIRQPGACGNTLLHLAALFCSPEHVGHVLRCIGGDVDFVNLHNENGFTALHLAVQRDSRPTSIWKLIEGGAKTDVLGRQVTALELHMLCYGQSFNVETVQLLGVTDIHRFIENYTPSPPPGGIPHTEPRVELTNNTVLEPRKKNL